ncbi:MAG: radical SAM protein [Saprospiraceae bacterium]|nr:radical SAM protein [Saprospiraceae bacterium]
MKTVFLLTPPFTQLNTPYPATAYLKGFLNTKGISSYQMDLGIEVILRIFSKNGLSQIKPAEINPSWSPNAKRIYSLWEEYLHSIDSVIGFLQGKQASLAARIVQGSFLPQASRFEDLIDLEWAFGRMGVQDKAKHFATLYLEDLSDFIKECIDPHFGFSRYAEKLGRSANTFDEMHGYMEKSVSQIDKLSLQILADRLDEQGAELVCISVPFPGNLYSAFRCAQFIKRQFPNMKIALGGGFPNTELRELSESRVFDYFDFVCLDDGERPLENLLNHIQGKIGLNHLKRTFHRIDNQVIYFNQSRDRDYHQHELGTPDYTDLPLEHYISVIEIANPMHSLWTDGRWNKLTMAHGCYWGKCTFCDISLDYIKLYEPIAASLLADRMEEMIQKTGTTGFHFVDEAAPPALMRELALEILRRNMSVSWWTNIRFEKSFTLELCQLLSQSGCIAVSGGLEVASDRLLQLIQKGVSVAQVSMVANHFSAAGIMVHAYLMYGFPTQTVQETVDSLEMVRQMFAAGIIQSGFWHQFALTAHSPVGMNPSEYGLAVEKVDISFANNDLAFKDKTGIDHNRFTFGLRKSIYNFMHGIGLDFSLQEWFEFKIPKTQIRPSFVEDSLLEEDPEVIKPHAKWVWIGNIPIVENENTGKTKDVKEKQILHFHSKQDEYSLRLKKHDAECLMEALDKISFRNSGELKTYDELKKWMQVKYPDFELLWFSNPIRELRSYGLFCL